MTFILNGYFFLFFLFYFLVNKLIAQEGSSFLQMRIKHLLKSNLIPQATALSKLCAESKEISNVSSFQQAYITCLCSILPNEDAIKEVSKIDHYLVIYGKIKTKTPFYFRLLR